MKAIVCTRSGGPDVLHLTEIQQPILKDNEILIKVYAATVTRGDVILRKMHPLLALPLGIFGVKKMKVPGVEFAGEIAEIGKDVNHYEICDKVFGTTTGLRFGANAEYVVVPENPNQGVLSLMPSNATFEEAAALPVGGMTAFYLLKKANINPGENVLIYGASGSVGTFALQLAKQVFNAKVTGVSSTKNLEMVKSLGADEIIDYTKQDLLQTGQVYDVVFDAVGKLPRKMSKMLLKNQGIFLTVQTPTRETNENLRTLKMLFEAGKIKPVIDRIFSLEDIPEAHRYVETGHKLGNVAIKVTEPESGGK